MNTVSLKLIVYFEEPFWVGIIEKVENETLSAVKIVFGSEPKDYEIYSYILDNYFDLQYSPTVETVIKESKGNPKRMQREIHKQTQDKGIGTKSQQALKLQYEQNKEERKTINRERRIAEEARLFEMKQKKKKEKHRGR